MTQLVRNPNNYTTNMFWINFVSFLNKQQQKQFILTNKNKKAYHETINHNVCK